MEIEENILNPNDENTACITCPFMYLYVYAYKQ